MDDRQPVSLARRALSYLICYLVAVQPMLPAMAAQITPVTPGTQMDKAGNGVPVVNIATPNGAGISHNQYQQYNVGQEGLILNNATGQLNQTQIGGLIQNNPNLKAGHEAQAIINEVTGASRSQLQGYTEVAGKAANVMVANPYGITCNGCGFINTPNVTLTTGKPQLDANGNLSSLEVTKGSVTVEGKGLDGSGADAVSIIARATEINAGIHAKDLSVTVGANRVGANGSVTPIAGEGAAPSVAVDTGALGGMYANRIHLVSSEKGVGVNLGNLVARQGDIQLDANGKLTLSNSLSSGALTANGASVALSGDNKATGQITVSAQQDATLGQGTLVSDAGIAVTAKGNLTSNGTSLTAGLDIRLNGATLAADRSTRANAGSNIQLQAQNQISNSGQLTAADSLSVDTRQLNNSGALAASTINVKAGTLQNSNGASVAATRSLTTVSDVLLNQGVLSAPVLEISSTQTDNSGMLQGTSAFSFSGSSLKNLSGGTLSSNNGFSLNLPTLNNSGLISSGATLKLSGHNLTNSGEINAANLFALNDVILNNSGSSLLAAQALQLNNHELTNGGKMAAVQLTLNSDVINNSGSLQAKQILQTQSQQMTNSGSVLSEGQLTLDTAALSNTGSLQGRQLSVNADNWFNSGKVLSLAEGTLKTGSLNNTGSIFSQQALDLNSGQTDNNGLIQGTTALRFSGQRLTNLAKGTVSSDNSFRLDLPELNNAGLISSGAALTLSGGSLTNSGEISAAGITADSDSLSNQQSGLLLADNVVQLKNGSLYNAGQIAANQLDISSATVENSGTLQGKQALQATGQQLTNSGTVLSGGQLILGIEQLGNSGLIQGQQLQVNAGNWQNSGNALSASDAELHADTLNNSGKILGQQNLKLHTDSTDNSGWLMAQALTLQGDLINSGLLQGDNALTLQGDKLVNEASGQMLTAGNAEARSTDLDNKGAIQADKLDVWLQSWQNDGDVLAASQLNAQIGGALHNSGTLFSDETFELKSSELSNTGTLAADQLEINAIKMTNGGLIQGSSTLALNASEANNLTAGRLLSGGAFHFTGSATVNNGIWQAQNLDFVTHSLTNEGVIQGITSLTGTIDGLLNNHGNMLTGGNASFSAGSLLNSGKLVANTLLLRGDSLINGGLWQGSDSLDAVATGDITQEASGKALSGGDLLLTANTLSTAGTLQGGSAQIKAGNWQHKGSLLSSEKLYADVNGELNNSGKLLSQGTAQISAQTLGNSGALLAEKALILNGGVLNNSGTVQGDSLAIRPASITNQGSLIGLQSLTLGPAPATGFRMLAAPVQPARTLVNNSGGQLLTQGTLDIRSDDIINNGFWQGQQILLDAASLANGGTIQSAGDLALNVSGAVISGTGSKITANGSAALNAFSLANQGQWIAKNLTLQGATLNNSGEITGAEGLKATLTGALTQQQNAALLSGATLELRAASVNNSGRMQGKDLQLSSGTVINSGRLQGDNGLVLNTTGRLTNDSSAKILGQHDLTLTTPELYNYGLIQGATSHITATSTVNNSGKLLSSADFTLTTPQMINSGWLQASQLMLNATNASNNGTLMADQQATLTGASLLNQGTAQGGKLEVNYAQLNNNGTVLGVNQLNVKATNVTQQAAGKLFSGGNLLLESTGFDQLGQVVALGDATLKLINGFTTHNTLAAGNRLSITSNGAIDNRGTLQGQALTLSAGGDLTNNGQITTGLGDSALSGNRINMNVAGTLQGGGNIELTGRSDVTLNGFTGTRGNLTINSPGSIVNTTLLYAAQNLYLYANSIRNQRGDMLAGSSLWMQRDAAGNANAEVVNTSGNIETQDGDINIKTAHLLNERLGIKASAPVTESLPLAYDWLTATQASVPYSYLGEDGVQRITIGCPQGMSACRPGFPLTGRDGLAFIYTTPVKEKQILEFAISRTTSQAISDGPAARISAGNNVIVRANTLNNNASAILAQGNMSLTGNILNNQSWFPGESTIYRTYKYKESLNPSTYIYVAEPQDRVENSVGGNPLRAVIQSGGNLTATFTNSIGNTNTTAFSAVGGNLLIKPTLNPLSVNTSEHGAASLNLTSVDEASITPSQWKNLLAGALIDIHAGSDIPDTAVPSVIKLQDKNANPAQMNNISSIIKNQSEESKNFESRVVDVSAYPLPQSDNGYFVTARDPQSPYLITVNPLLSGLGALDQSLYGDLYALLGKQPGNAPQEIRSQFTQTSQFIGSAYMLDRLKIQPDSDHLFLGDAAFDTRYASNTILAQTGNRYLNGVGSDLQQMQYLMDNAAKASESLKLQFGVSLSADQIAALDKSIIWWEIAVINGKQVFVPKVYLSAKDTALNNGSVIAANNVELSSKTLDNSSSAIVSVNNTEISTQSGINSTNAAQIIASNNLTIHSAEHINNSASTLSAGNNLSLISKSDILNHDGSVINADGALSLSALSDITNLSSAIKGNSVELKSITGSINNITETSQWNATYKKELDRFTGFSSSQTVSGQQASINAKDALSLNAAENISVTGATLTSGGAMSLSAGQDIAITANTLTENSRARAGNSDSVSHQESVLSAGNQMTVQAGHDLNVTASTIKTGGDASLFAGNNLSLNSAASLQKSGRSSRESHSSDIDRTSVSSGGDIVLSSKQDITSQAAVIAAEGDLSLQAGRNINLNAEESRSGNSQRGGKKTIISETVRQQGTEIASGGDINLNAGHDINSRASDVTAQQDIVLHAGNNVDLGTATESDYYYKEETKIKKGLLSKKTTHTIQEDSATNEKGTLLSGNNVSVSAGNDVLVTGSQVVGDGKVALNAVNNVEINAATNTDSAWRFSETRKSGLMGTGGLGISIGSSKTLHEVKDKGTTQSQSVSTVGSTAGDVSITAGKQLQVNGADLIAGGNMSLQGDSIAITPGHDQRTRDERFEQRTSGLTLALSGAVAEAVNSAVAAAQSAKQESDGRLAALQATKAVLSGVQASQASQLAQAKGDPNNGVGISISLTTQQSKSQQHQASDMVSGSTINAGKNLSIDAIGKGNAVDSGNLLIAGSQLKAGGDTSLHAANDITLTGAASTQQSTGKNSSSGGGIGLSFGVGSGSAGLSIFASVNGAKGHEKGNGTVWSETTLDSGGEVSITSGRDTTLSGAQVNGNSVRADIGRDLTITSLQDSDNYDSKQISFGAGGSFTFGSMSGSGYINASRDKMHSNYDSVLEQSGIYAGKGGFDITAGNHTQLNGAVIASQADADKNRLDTGTLGFTNIHNEADYKVEHQGIGISSGASMGGQFAGNMANTLLAGAGSKGHAEGTTQSAVAEGTIVVRDQANQQQSLADLSRDTEHANNSISPIFNKEKEQKRLQTAQMIAEIGGQVADIARTQGDINGLNAAKEKLGPLKENATEKERAAYLDMLRDSPEYKAEMQKFGTGSSLQRGIQAATAAIQGLAGGNTGQAISGAVSPYLAEQIHKLTTDANGKVNTEANLMAHAALGAVTAYAAGNSALAGASGAVMGEYIAQQLYPGIKREDLSEEQKQTISALGTLAAGLTGGIVGNSTANAVAGAQAGKNAIENNHLNTVEKITLTSKEKEYNSSCQGENAGNNSCRKLKQDIDKLYEKGQSIDKTEYSELGPDFQLGGVDSIKHKPGEVVSCVGSGNGYCVVTDTSAVNGQEWMLEPANEVQAIAAKHQNGKTEDFIKELGAAYFEAGCGMPGVSTVLCQSYMAAGGANPVSGKVPTDAERVTWAMAAAANTVGNVVALKAGNAAQGIVRVENLGSIDEFLASQSKNLNKKLGAKIGEGRLPYEAGKNGVELAKKTIKETLENATQISSKIPSSSVRGEYDLIHVYSSKTNNTVSLRVLPNGTYDFDTLIPEKSSKF